LPSFLTGRGWSATLANPGGGAFTLGPRGERIVRPRLISGQDFTALELEAAGRVAVDLLVLANGLVVGGLSYVLDSSLKEPPREIVEPEKEEDHEGLHHPEPEPRRDVRGRLSLDVDLD